MRHSQDCLGAGEPCCYGSLAPDDAFVHPATVAAPSPSAAHAALLAEAEQSANMLERVGLDSGHVALLRALAAALRAASPSPVLCAKCGHGGTEMGHAALWCYEDGCTCTGWIASPSPGAVEAAYREGYRAGWHEGYNGGSSLPRAAMTNGEDRSWQASAAQRGAAGGQDG